MTKYGDETCRKHFAADVCPLKPSTKQATHKFGGESRTEVVTYFAFVTTQTQEMNRMFNDKEHLAAHHKTRRP